MINDTKASVFKIDVLDISGQPVDIGQAMGRALCATEGRLQQFRSFVKHEAQEFRRLESYSDHTLSELRAFLETEAEKMTQWLDAMAEQLSIDHEELLLLGIGAFFRDLMHCRSSEGCSTFAVSKTSDGAIVGKNRDSDSKYGPWQVMIRVHPERGYMYTGMTTYGVPGINSSGMNALGLAVADTHVVSEDIGVGLPRYALEHEILTSCSSVEEALELVLERPLMGRGNLILADKRGNLGVAELGNQLCAVRKCTGGVLVNTNHFTDPVLQTAFVDVNTRRFKGTSERRYRKLQELLSLGVSGLAGGKSVLSYHGDDLDSLCRHEEVDPPSRTISTVFYMPNRGRVVFAGGYPCMAHYQEITC